MIKGFLVLVALVFSGSVSAEWATYENVELYGLSRDGSWNEVGSKYRYSMVCNVNGDDGFLSVRSCASTDCKIKRNLKRLATVRVNITQTKQNGNWVRVTTAFRTHTEDGFQYDETKDLHVSGWAHTGYLCDFGS